MALINFSDLPIRLNGQKIEASWFNSMRTLLIQIFGEAQGETTQPIGQNDTNQNVINIENIDKSDFSQVDVSYIARRSTDDPSEERMQAGSFSIQYWRQAGVWRLGGDQENLRGNDGKIEFSLLEDTGSGSNIVTLRYSTTSINGGNHLGDLKVRAVKWIA